ncbi:MAG: RluA family pseudouridine synthase, partial [Firmicutes bacterium]|nr:RluA family pseudouridine synthase [Bacillota bacterium]
MDKEYIFTISGEYAGERIDSVLSLLLEGVSRSYVQKLISGGNVSVDGKSVKKNYILTESDNVKVILPEPVPCDAQPENIPLDIV